MLIVRPLLFCLLVLSAFGCSGAPDVAGVYATEVSQFQGKQAIVGELHLNPSGCYKARIGELDMSGTWKAANNQVFLSGSDDVSKFLPEHYRIESARLIAQFEGVDAKQWRFVRKDSKSVANRLQ
ncbi:MAG: hypothetical protein H7Y17_08330, partial [Chlorobia bacterium]|nr:hypothetical protein [Fimbriimonadaceae bacterium]